MTNNTYKYQLINGATGDRLVLGKFNFKEIACQTAHDLNTDPSIRSNCPSWWYLVEDISLLLT